MILIRGFSPNAYRSVADDYEDVCHCGHGESAHNIVGFCGVCSCTMFNRDPYQSDVLE